MFISLTKQGDDCSYFIDTKNYILDNDGSVFGLDKDLNVTDPASFVGDFMSLYIYDKQNGDEENKPTNMFEYILDYFSDDNSPELGTSEWEEYKKNGWDNIAYKVVIGKNDDELYIFKNNTEMVNTLDDLKANRAVWNKHKNDADVYDIDFFPMIYLFHDHKNTFTIDLDANFAGGFSPYDYVSADKKPSVLEFAKVILEMMIGIGDNTDDITNETWSSMIQDFSKYFIDCMVDVQDGCFCPSELIWEDDFKDKKEEIEKYKNDADEPSYDVDINLKKHLVTFRFLKNRRCKFYLDFSTKEEYNKGWFTNSAKFGKSYINDRKQ